MSAISRTKRLYYEDCYQKEFTALIREVGRDERGSYVILDQTLFFPEGGGQPSDRGTLDGCPVNDVQIIEGDIRHYISGFFGCGDTVCGRIDWDRRFDLMQQHSGEHIVSGRIHDRFGYDNVGFHMGEKLITIDLNGPMDERQLAEIEAEVNDYIWKDIASRSFFASDEEIGSLPYRSKLDLTEEVRLVEFAGADLCACCGLHVRRTGEIGLVKLISVHNFRQGVRIEMLSGKRAFDYLNTNFIQNSRIAVKLSARPEATLEALEKVQEEAFALRGQILRLNREKYEKIAGQCRGLRDVVIFAEALTPADIRKCADEVLNHCQGICVLLSGNDEEGYRYAAGIREGDIRELVKNMNQELSGRGGGKSVFAQGSLNTKRKDAEEFFITRGFTLI